MKNSDPAAFFSSWKTARLDREDLKPMGTAGLTQTLLVWRHWLAFCQTNAIAWDMACSLDIARFCQAIGPRSKIKKTSPVTLRRYWRVLRDLYAHALEQNLVTVNPADGAQPVATERVPSLALSGPMWTALHDGLYEGFPGDNDFKARRNRLALLLMMNAALTVREIVGLKMDCAEVCAPQDVDTAADPDPGIASPSYALRVQKADGKYLRILQLDTPTSAALHAWLEVRAAGLSGIHPGSSLVVGDRIGRSIAPNGLYNICQAHLARCLVEEGLLAAPAPSIIIDPGALAHMGPNTLRNTCIAAWFNGGMPLQEIQRRCGFKDASVMSRLGAHLLSPFPL